MRKQIQDAFNTTSENYDSERRQLIPCFDGFYRAAVSLAIVDQENPRILDLGAGTGIFSKFLQARYPKAEFTLIDISEKMLEQAKTKLNDRTAARYWAGDYLKLNWKNPYDLVVSALSIHHLTTAKKRVLYKKIFDHLRHGGCFVNADQIRGATPQLDELNKREWKTRIEGSRMPVDKIAAAYSRMQWDREDPLADQLDCLSKLGFIDVGCVFQWYSFAVMAGRRP